LDPSGIIHGSDGGDRVRDLTRPGGAGAANTGTIGSLVNRGAIIGGTSGGASGAAIYSTGPDASIGCVTNSGKIIGHVKID
jgi:hypothetical protein